MTLRLIIFDLDDTLWDAAPVIETAESALREWLSQHAPQLDAPTERLHEQRRQLLEQEPALAGRVSELRRRMLERSLRAAGYAEAQTTQLAEAAFEHFLAARQQVSLFPEAHTTLARLAERYTLGVLTNGNADVQRIGIAEYFQITCSAEQLGVAKPDPRAFHAVLQRAGVAAEQAVHIGDHPRDDIAGALGAGLRAIWVNPQGKRWEGEAEAQAQIASLAELPNLLERWQSGR